MPLTKLSRKYHLLKKSKRRSKENKDQHVDEENKNVNSAIVNLQHHAKTPGSISIVPETSSSSDNDMPKINPEAANSNCNFMRTNMKSHFNRYDKSNSINPELSQNREKGAANESQCIRNDIPEFSEISYMDCQNWKRFESTHIDHLAGTKEHDTSCFTEDLSNILQEISGSSDNVKESNEESYHSVEEEPDLNIRKLAKDNSINPGVNKLRIENKKELPTSYKCDIEKGQISKPVNRSNIFSPKRDFSRVPLKPDGKLIKNDCKILAKESGEEDNLSSLSSESDGNENPRFVKRTTQNVNQSQLKKFNYVESDVFGMTMTSNHKVSDKRRSVRRSILGRNEVVLISSESDSSIEDSKCTYRSKCCWKKHLLLRAPLPKLPDRIDFNVLDEPSQQPFKQPANINYQNPMSASRIANIEKWIEVSPFRQQSSKSSKTLKIRQIEESSSGSEFDLTENVEDSSLYSHATSKQNQPQSSELQSHIAMNPKNDIKNNNKTSSLYTEEKDIYKSKFPDKNSLLARNSNFIQPIYNIIHEESSELSSQIQNTPSEDKRTSKELIDSSVGVLERSDDDSIGQENTSSPDPNILSERLKTLDISRNEKSSLEKNSRIPTEEDQLMQSSLANDLNNYCSRRTDIRRNNREMDETNDYGVDHDLDLRLSEMLERENSLRLDKQNQAVLSESSDECNRNSPAKNSVCLQVSITDSDSSLSSVIIDKSTSVQNGANSPNSKSNKSQDPVDSSVEETESIDLLQNLNNQNQSDIDLVHNKNPTQELQLILSSDSESDKRNSHLHFEKDSMLGPKIKEPDSVNSHRRSKIKNIFGNYVSISDEEGDEDEENGEENEIEREENFESPQIDNALEGSNNYETINNVNSIRQFW